jgi:cyclic pyranopterin phosphate synthase
VTGHTFPPPLARSYALVDGKVVTRSLEAHVVDHCNLTCAECCSLSPHLPQWFAEPAALARDLARATQFLSPRVFKLVGGEPLLHPGLVELVELVRASGIAPRISITTNGLLLGRTPDTLWEGIDGLTISLYPRPALSAASRAAIQERAARFEVALNWKQQDEFVVMTRPSPTDDTAATAAIFDGCWIRERCHMLRDGRFYTCTRPPHLQAYHRGALDLTGDGIRLDEATAEQVHAYLTRPQPLEACAHCLGGSNTLRPHRLLTRDELLRLRR